MKKINYSVISVIILAAVIIYGPVFAQDTTEQAAEAPQQQTTQTEEQPPAVTEQPVLTEQPPAATEQPATQQQPVLQTEQPPQVPAAEITPTQPQPIPEEIMEKAEPGENILLLGLLPKDAIQQGAWKWDTAIKFEDLPSHTNEAKDGIQEHSFKSTAPVTLPPNSMIVQYVYLDPQAAPKGIMLKLYLAKGEELGVYWEGEEEVFTGVANYETTWYMDVMPEAGKWIRLEVLAEELGIEGEALAGVSFITADGTVYWGKTSIVKSKVVNKELPEEVPQEGMSEYPEQ